MLLGALGDPRVPGLEHARDILFGLRFGLDLYANMRPVKALADRLVPLKERGAKDVDFMVFRENTEGIYVGMGGQFKRGTPDEIAINEDLNTRKGVERLIRAGFDYAKKNGKKTVHLADKSNAMKHAHELWYRCFFEVAKEYPGIEGETRLRRRDVPVSRAGSVSMFEVVVTCNLFGDIVTDLGAGLQGVVSGWLAARTSTTSDPSRPALFEPVHGSAPPLAGKDLANPFASLPHRGDDADVPRLPRRRSAHRGGDQARPSKSAAAPSDVGGDARHEGRSRRGPVAARVTARAAPGGPPPHAPVLT